MLGKNVNKLYGVIVVLTVLNGIETWSLGAAERMRLNVMGIRYLRSVGWSHMDGLSEIFDQGKRPLMGGMKERYMWIKEG